MSPQGQQGQNITFSKNKNKDEKDLVHHIEKRYVFTLLALPTLLASLQPIITCH
jgi:hypothetical protein